MLGPAHGSVVSQEACCGAQQSGYAGEDPSRRFSANKTDESPRTCPRSAGTKLDFGCRRTNCKSLTAYGGACHARKPGTNVVVLPRALGSPPRSNGRVTAMPRRPATRPTSLPDNDHLTADQGGHRFAKPVLPRHTPCCWTRLATSKHAREVARGYRMAESGHGEREGVPRTLT